MKLRFVPKYSRLRSTLDQVLEQISEDLQLEKPIVSSCLECSLYQIKHKNIHRFQHLEEEDRLFFLNSLIRCFQSSLAKEIDAQKGVSHIRPLIHDAAAIAIDLP